MGSHCRCYFLWSLIVLTTSLTPPVSAVGVEDCQKAEKFYLNGTKLLNYEQRRQVFQAAVDLCPSFAEAHVNLADAMENLAMASKEFSQSNLRLNNRLLDTAIQEYQEALKYNGKLVAAHVGLGENYLRIGLYVRAREAFQNGLNLDSNNKLAVRAKAGLEQADRLLAKECDGFKSSDEIVLRYKLFLQKPMVGKLMGFEEFTAVRDRQRFTNIVFDEWSSRLNRKETIAQLEEIGKAVSSADLAQCRFVVEGHTDNRGGYERNQRLSDQRAQSVKAYLTERFTIDPPRITTQGFGYSRPRFPNNTAEHMLGNRRVEMLIIERIRPE